MKAVAYIMPTEAVQHGVTKTILDGLHVQVGGTSIV